MDNNSPKKEKLKLPRLQLGAQWLVLAEASILFILIKGQINDEKEIEKKLNGRGLEGTSGVICETLLFYEILFHITALVSYKQPFKVIKLWKRTD
ncbi:CLUMA_CG013217, isoform A [Clunio marinus]|uniref:CLUMA_CG013217, isoform A n=1 Tax=Clunio marinus TaxID=568069 RepID=A0A1J1IJH4_9DIPT|nr:CLUMA_CG013217, isoform A [Clunio marinus]